MTRLSLTLVAILVVTSCHSIDRGVFAQGPVPLDVLPLREPITYTAGPNAGQVVPTQHGLLASYFSGAAYVQPTYGEVLDHQQIDPNVDFQWEASGGVNPVIAVGGIDVSEGHPFRPPQWPIWSIVWEGYLETPTTGDHILSLHVNNGGWVEMKDRAGGLRTVISCPGGSGFEGDCPATVSLTAGSHYIRISYYNNAPSAANAIFSWQRPGDAGPSVVRTESLCTQDVVGCAVSRRGFIFVHGIRGNFDEPGFSALLTPLQAANPGRVQAFRYFQDVGDLDLRTGNCAPREMIIPANSHGLPLTLTPRSLDRSICDSQSDVGLNAVLLDEDVRAMSRGLSGGPITLIANSMGGAIVRAFLAYTVEARTGAAEIVDSIFFLQGAQQGGYLAYAKPLLRALLVPTGPGRELVFNGVSELVREATGWDASRPAMDDLLPFFSETYRYTNPEPAHIPDHISYFNVASDIRWSTRIDVVGLGFVIPIRIRAASGSSSFGDYVILPGEDDPRELPLLGGARLRPLTIGRGRESVQWMLERDLQTRMEVIVQYLPTAPLVDAQTHFPGDPLHIPESHLELGGLDAEQRPQMHKILVHDRFTRTLEPLDDVLLRELARLDRR